MPVSESGVPAGYHKMAQSLTIAPSQKKSPSNMVIGICASGEAHDGGIATVMCTKFSAAVLTEDWLLSDDWVAQRALDLARRARKPV